MADPARAVDLRYRTNTPRAGPARGGIELADARAAQPMRELALLALKTAGCLARAEPDDVHGNDSRGEIIGQRRYRSTSIRPEVGVCS